MSADVDVVVLVWNRLEDTLQCIESVLCQKGVDLQLWLVDQGSRDECLEVLRARAQASNVHLLELGQNLGVPGGRNLGMRAGRAPYIVCLDNDAVFSDSEVLKRTVAEFESRRELGALAYAIWDGTGKQPDVGSWGFPYPVETHFEKTFPTARYCGAGHAIRRRAFEATAGYDERLVFFAEELDLAYQLVECGYRLQYLPELGVNHYSSQEARLSWRGGRFRYNVRNMLYLNFKYFRSWFQFWTYAMGYLMKGLINGEHAAALTGIRESLGWVRDCLEHRPLSQEARAYIHANEMAPRGSLWTRITEEVLVRWRFRASTSHTGDKIF